MRVAHVVGVDPGLVHTGWVYLQFRRDERLLYVSYHVIQGPDAQQVKALLDGINGQVHGFIEGYRPRSHFGTDAQMVAAVKEMKQVTGYTVLDNTGVKKVVKQRLMELLKCWSFPATTHHQDLRSAARIALLGMFKDEQLNQVVADVVRDHLDGRPWDVR